MRNFNLISIFLIWIGGCNFIFGQPPVELLSRGCIAIPSDSGVFISWRLLANDSDSVAFNVYRNKENTKPLKLNMEPLVAATSFLDVNSETGEAEYFVKKVTNSLEQAELEYGAKALVWKCPFKSIPLQTPEGYSPNDGSLADLDGDGEYEIVIHMVGVGHDNSHNGNTTAPIFQAYKFDGQLMWTINLGTNIREGAHYTPFLVYDFDGDGKAEVTMKTSDGSIDGLGNVIGDSTLHYPNELGHILKGNEFLSLFDGVSGKELATVSFVPERYPGIKNPSFEELKNRWGDGKANRSERYLGGVAYLDGKNASIVMSRGYYERVGIATWDWDGKELTQRWVFDSEDGTESSLAVHGQGNHSLSIADVDDDGKDEIIFGSAVIDDDGKALNSTGNGHGDALHVSDLDPEHPGLEIFTIQERFDDAGMNFRDAKTGEILWKIASVKAAESGGDKGEGPGRGVSFNVDPRFPGNENWVFGAGIKGMYSSKGELITSKTPRSCNFGIWWDGDLLREILDRNYIAKWNWREEQLDVILSDDECWSNNGTKSTPVISADIFGDWREEVIWRTKNNKELRIYSTTIPTTYRFVSLMQDHIYRMSIAWQNAGYNQPPHPSFYIGE